MLKSIKQSGFTIIEMATVIVVMGVLALIVTTAYQNYDKNAKGSQTGSAVSSYKSAVETGIAIETDTSPSESYSINGDFLAACVTSNTERCCFYYHLFQQVLCQNNTELKAEGLLVTDNTYNIVQKYVSDKKAQLPNFTQFGTLTKCTSKRGGPYYTRTPPCYSNHIAYTTGQLTTNDKGFLHYFLPATYDNCFSDKVVSYGSGFPELTGAKYTDRITTGGAQYTYCIIELD